MPRKILITSPVPSLEETARAIGLSQKRAWQIAERMDAIVDRRLRASGQSAGWTRAARAPMRVGAKGAIGTRARTPRS
jgi:molybdenum-dependent DNA-binding transcriptional regulator ModE